MLNVEHVSGEGKARRAAPVASGAGLGFGVHYVTAGAVA